MKKQAKKEKAVVILAVSWASVDPEKETEQQTQVRKRDVLKQLDTTFNYARKHSLLVASKFLLCWHEPNDSFLGEMLIRKFIRESKYEITHLLIREGIKHPDIVRLKQKLAEQGIQLVQVPAKYDDPQEEELSPQVKAQLVMHYMLQGFMN